MATVAVLQHNPCETLGILGQALTAASLRVEYVRPGDGQQVPRHVAGYAGLVVLGGPMGVYEQARYPWLAAEMRLIDLALKAGAPILGICLGSQLLAAALGARVCRGPRQEIGWHEVRLCGLAAADALWSSVAAGQDAITAFHWHGDLFDLPAGAGSLASSALTACQAFVYGRNAYGLLFHLEVTLRIVADMVGAFGGQLREAGLDGAAILEEAPRRLPALHRVGRPVFQALARMALP